MRAAGLVVRAYPATLEVVIDGEASLLTPLLRAALARVWHDFRAEVLAEVAGVASMAEAAGLPADIVLTFHPPIDDATAVRTATRTMRDFRPAA